MLCDLYYFYSDVRKLIIPPHLGYGDQGVPNVIPRKNYCPLIVWVDISVFFFSAKSTLIFSVELIEIKQKSLIPLPKGTGFYTILGVVAVILLIGYELYKRANQQTKEAKKQKTHHSNKSGKKNKNKHQ